MTFLHQGCGAGSSPVICEDLLCSRCPVTGGISCRTGGTAAALPSAEWQCCWACKTCSCRNIIFTTIIIFSVSLDTWCFVFSVYGCALVQLALVWLFAVVWQVGAQSWQPRESHRIRAFNQCLWWLQFGASCKDLVLGNKVSLGYHPDFVICWSERELWKRLPASRAVWQLLYWVVGRLGYLFFFPFNWNFLLFPLNQIGGPASLLALQEQYGSG